MSIKDDFNFYLKNKDVYNFAGRDINEYVEIFYDKNGKSAFECFNEFDSKGIKKLITSEVDLLTEIIICKCSINLHCKMYAESLVDGTMFFFELEEISKEIEAPEWFLKSIKKQAANIIKNGNMPAYIPDYLF